MHERMGRAESGHRGNLCVGRRSGRVRAFDYLLRGEACSMDHMVATASSAVLSPVRTPWIFAKTASWN